MRKECGIERSAAELLKNCPDGVKGQASCADPLLHDSRPTLFSGATAACVSLSRGNTDTRCAVKTRLTCRSADVVPFSGLSGGIEGRDNNSLSRFALTREVLVAVGCESECACVCLLSWKSDAGPWVVTEISLSLSLCTLCAKKPRNHSLQQESCHSSLSIEHVGTSFHVTRLK